MYAQSTDSFVSDLIPQPTFVTSTTLLRLIVWQFDYSSFLFDNV